MLEIKSVPVENLRRICDTKVFSFKSTADLDPLDGSIGQDRAIEAAHFGLGIRRPGYNLFALGPPGTGKMSTVAQFVEKIASEEEVPPDWCYVNNFEESHRPKAMRLPPGRGGALKTDMEKLVDELRASIPAAFESDDYQVRKQAIIDEYKERQETALRSLNDEAKEKNIALIRTPMGLALAPRKGEEVLSPDEFEQLPESDKDQIKSEIEILQKELQGILQEVPRWESEQRERNRELEREVTRFAVGHLIDAVRKRYEDLPAVLQLLDAIQKDVLENTEEFVKTEQQAMPMIPGMPPRGSNEAAIFRRYQINLIVDNGRAKGAPVVYEDQPTHQSLIGRVEHVAQMGALLTDYSLIKPGAFHRANGGYLVLDTRRLLMSAYAWEDLKSSLRQSEIKIESLGERLGLVSTVSLEPEPIPLNVKVILVGDHMIYYLLSSLDPDFAELFKVQMDFDDEMDRSRESMQLYARLVATLAKKESLRPFDPDAVGRIIEQSSRVTSDSEKLSTRMAGLQDLLSEADYWAGIEKREVVGAEDVERAIQAQIRRADRVRERMIEEVHRGTIVIETEGEQTGQINGLSVLQLAGFAFGRPSRITARVRMGRGQVIDIEREVALGGPLHSKGVLILSGFLGERFAQEMPLALSASLVFEQSYSGVDGDSASSTELYALLSALANAPIKQSLAVTGSVDQHGNVQAIGGVNEKIEGFFDTCKEAGLNGAQGVLIPAANVKHLMLRQDVVDAAKAGKFTIYPVGTIDQGIEILTGVSAGERGTDGKFPDGTINARVEKRLKDLAVKARAFGAAARRKKHKKNGDGKEPESDE
jgi:lon-related putative ATP-dependent protease